MAPPQAAVAEPATTTKAKASAAPRARRSPRRANVTPPATPATIPEEPIAEATARPVEKRAANGANGRDSIATDITDVWFQVARGSQTATLETLRKVVDAVVPFQGDDDSRRRKLIDGAFELADRAGAAPLGLARGAMLGTVLVHFDVDVNVETDVDAFNGVDVGVTVPTNVKTLSI